MVNWCVCLSAFLRRNLAVVYEVSVLHTRAPAAANTGPGLGMSSIFLHEPDHTGVSGRVIKVYRDGWDYQRCYRNREGSK